MRKSRLKLRCCGKITAIVILLTFLKPFPMFAEQPMAPLTISSEEGTRYYTDSEIELLIDDLTVAALEAIEQAAGEAARAAFLASLEREALLLQARAQQQREAERWRIEAENNLLAIKAAKRAGIKNTVFGVVIGILGGLALGVGGTVLMRN